MGTHFMGPAIKGGSGAGMNMAARAVSAPGYAARTAAGNEQKDLGAVRALANAKVLGKSTGSAAYPPGPKKV